MSWTAGGQYGPNLADAGWFVTANASLVFRPADNVRLSAGPSYLKDIDPRGFATNIADPTATQFGGTRSVFARLEQRNLSLTTRANATFTPNLTLELFAQPFIASGRYSELNEYRAPRCAGSIARARRCSSSGRSSAPAAPRSARSMWAEMCRRCFVTGPSTCSR